MLMTDEHEAFRTMVRAYVENEIGAGTDQENQCRARRRHLLSAHVASRRAARARLISFSGGLPC
jgi:hypothetical protein